MWLSGQLTVFVQIIRKSCLPAPCLDLAFGDLGEDVDVPLGELRSDRPVAISGVTEHPFGAALQRLSIDQVLGLRTVRLPPGATCTAVISGSLVFVAAAESL